MVVTTLEKEGYTIFVDEFPNDCGIVFAKLPKV
jgi:hypothetical protein